MKKLFTLSFLLVLFMTSCLSNQSTEKGDAQQGKIPRVFLSDYKFTLGAKEQTSNRFISYTIYDRDGNETIMSSDFWNDRIFGGEKWPYLFLYEVDEILYKIQFSNRGDEKKIEAQFRKLEKNLTAKYGIPTKLNGDYTWNDGITEIQLVRGFFENESSISLIYFDIKLSKSVKKGVDEL